MPRIAQAMLELFQSGVKGPNRSLLMRQSIAGPPHAISAAGCLDKEKDDERCSICFSFPAAIRVAHAVPRARRPVVIRDRVR
jgi:hypothetical protein